MKGYKSYFKQVMSLAWPAIVSNITTPLLALVDIAIVGHMPGEWTIGAVAVGGTAFNMVYWLFGFLRMGASGLTAQAYGRGDAESQAMVLWRSLSIGVLAGIVLLGLSPMLGGPGLSLIGARGETYALALDYFRVLIWGAPAVLASYALSGWFLGMQDSRTPMVMALVTNVVNIPVSVVAVYCLDMGVTGVALGTLSAQYVGLAVGLASMVYKFRPRMVSLSSLVDREGLSSFFKVNAYIFLRTVCLVAVTIWFTHAGAAQSDLVLSANAVLMQFFMLFSYFIDGFAYSAEALVGRYHGSGDKVALRLVTALLLRIGLCLAVIFSLAYFVGGECFLNILTDKAHVVSAAGEYLPWVVSVPLCGMAAFVYDGVFIGMTEARGLLVSMLVGAGVYFGLYFGLGPIMGNHALWLAFVAYLASRGVVEHVIFKRVTKDQIS